MNVNVKGDCEAAFSYSRHQTCYLSKSATEATKIYNPRLTWKLFHEHCRSAEV